MTLYHGPLYIIILNSIVQKWSTEINHMMRDISEEETQLIRKFVRVWQRKS